MTTPPLNLVAIRALCEAATPGPWIAELDCFDMDDGIDAIVSNDGTTILFKSNTGIPMHRGSGPDGEWTAGDSAKRDAQWAKARDGQELRDARFIAAARTLIPQLLAAVEQLQRERDDARAERDELIEAVIGGPQAKLVELTDRTAAERTAEAIAAWLDGDGTSTRNSALARMIRSGEWKENR